MTHFAVTVCIPGENQLSALNDALTDIMSAWDENRKVAPYRVNYSGNPGHSTYAQMLNPHTDPGTSDITGWEQLVDAWNTTFPDEPLSYDAEKNCAYEMSTVNPEGYWDYWTCGGRNFYTARRGALRSDLIQPGTRAATGEPLRYSGGRKRAIDFNAMRDETGRNAAAAHDDWTAITTEHGVPKSWTALRADVEAGILTIEQARSNYRNQPSIKAAGFFLDCPADEYSGNKLDYVEQERAGAGVGYALVTLDREWLALGRMGWWAMSSDNRTDRIAHHRRAQLYLDELPDEAIIVALDCHI